MSVSWPDGPRLAAQMTFSRFFHAEITPRVRLSRSDDACRGRIGESCRAIHPKAVECAAEQSAVLGGKD
jgi:hypothetical protein